MESKPQIEISSPDVPLKSASNLYWEAQCKNAILEDMGRFLPNVTYTQGPPFKAVFAMSHGDQDDICAEALDLTSPEMRVSRKELEAFVAAIDNFHEKAETPPTETDTPPPPDWFRALAHDFRIPDPRFMPTAWRVSAKKQKLIVLWGYHSGNEKDVILPLTPTSTKWDDAAKRIDIVKLFAEQGRIRMSGIAVLSRVAAAVALLACILFCAWRSSPGLRESGTELFTQTLAVLRGEACVRHYGTLRANGVCPECKADEENKAKQKAAEEAEAKAAAEAAAKAEAERKAAEAAAKAEAERKAAEAAAKAEAERKAAEEAAAKAAAEAAAKAEAERKAAEEAARKALEEIVAKAIAAFRKGDFDSGHAFAMEIPEDKIADAELQYFMGLFHEIKLRTVEDGEAMLKWFRRSAESGFAEAQYSLGFYLDSPKAIIRHFANKAEGRKWLEKAAAQGNEDAKKRLQAISGSDR